MNYLLKTLSILLTSTFALEGKHKIEQVVKKWQVLQETNCLLIQIGDNKFFESLFENEFKFQKLRWDAGKANFRQFLDSSKRNFEFGMGCTIFMANKLEILDKMDWFQSLGKAIRNQFWIIEGPKNVSNIEVSLCIFVG